MSNSQTASEFPMSTHQRGMTRKGSKLQHDPNSEFTLARGLSLEIEHAWFQGTHLNSDSLQIYEIPPGLSQLSPSPSKGDALRSHVDVLPTPSMTCPALPGDLVSQADSTVVLAAAWSDVTSGGGLVRRCLPLTQALEGRVAGQGSLRRIQFLLKGGLLLLHLVTAERALKVLDSGVKLGLEVLQDHFLESVYGAWHSADGIRHLVVLEEGRRVDQLAHDFRCFEDQGKLATRGH